MSRDKRRWDGLRALALAGVGVLVLAAGCEKRELKTPETSSLFVRHVDPETGVESWMLKPKSFAWNQQSIYFTAKSLTDDGRYLVFDYSDDEFHEDKDGRQVRVSKRKAVIDFLKDEIIALPGTDGSIPFLDPVTAKMYYTGKAGIWMNDLRADPTNRILVCPWPREFLALGKKCDFLATHPTMNADRTKMFVETRFDDAFYHGCINLKTGQWEHWGSTPFFFNHGQLCPSDENLALGAWEVDWVDAKGEHHPIRKIGPDSRYPRMWYLEPGDKRRMIDPGPENYATHEKWDEDGRGHYWNNRSGLWHYDRFTRKTDRISPFPAGHSSVSRDNRYVVSDYPVSVWGWRGQPWSVVFYDRQTGGAVFVHSRNSALCPPKPGSRLHPDPHPAFVCGERYILTTINQMDGHMDLCLTPVEPLKKRCAKATPLGSPLPADAHPISVGERICQFYFQFRKERDKCKAHGGSEEMDEEVREYARLTANHRILADLPAMSIGGRPKYAEDPAAVRAYKLIDKLVEGDGSVRTEARNAWIGVALAESPKDWLNILKAANLLLAVDSPAGRRPTVTTDGMGPFSGLAASVSPERVGMRIVGQFLDANPSRYEPPGFEGSYGDGSWVPYAAVSLWAHSIRFSVLTEDGALTQRLISKFEPFLPGGSCAKLFRPPYHVDDTIAGIVPYEIYRVNGDSRCLKMGDWYADTQWTPPCEESLKARHALPKERQEELWANGYTPQTRLWIDDMYMIIAIQEQAARVKKDRAYLNRAAHEMCYYLEQLQLKDGPDKGLFYHAPDVPFVWGRGDGWMAAGMALVLSQNPDEPNRSLIMRGYRDMMTALLKCQRPDGLWGQLVNDSSSWGETSGTAMFTYAFIVGVRNGWLDAKTYGSAARKAYLKLCSMLDQFGNLADVCTGTGKKNDRQYYLDRARVKGDPHGQAPMLWCINELLEWKTRGRCR